MLAGWCAIERSARLPADLAGGANVCVASLPVGVGEARMLLHLFFPDDRIEKTTSIRPRLTPRQRDVLRRVESGQTTKEIARDLDISVHTVRNHVQAILRTLGVPTRLRAVWEARRLRLL